MTVNGDTMNKFLMGACAFLSGVVLTLITAYVNYPKDLVSQQHFDDRLESLEKHIDSTDAHLEATDKLADYNERRINQNHTTILRLLDRLHMIESGGMPNSQLQQ